MSIVTRGIQRLFNMFGLSLVRSVSLQNIADQTALLLQHQAACDKQLRLLFNAQLRHMLKDKYFPEELECFICAHKNRTLSFQRLIAQDTLFSGCEIERFVCPNCKVIFGPVPLITAEKQSINELYELLYSHYSEGSTAPFQEKTFHSLAPQTSGKYLNFGCGKWQDELHKLRSHGWDVYGFEPNLPPQGEHIYSSFREIEKLKFDGIFSHNVIEHLQNPPASFSFLNTLLNPGSCMAHSTACYEYRYEMTPFHLFFYEQSSREYLAKNSGFRMVSSYVENPDVLQDRYINVIYEKIT